ncbi:type II toxin-antitoxin system Phd/YefM family antitoxin [Blastococcus colisei]|uniref:type II toxin-antitoxin system Phd/YefM family antitoxin n=1 Tax=Blastococcus colisei TaxID=1564162 RepID=UPI001FE7C720|nr:type II toxin-antitoxin system Phd/YefM family antitoxin [Blastococcus colisei]
MKAHVSHIIDEVAGTHERLTVTRNGSPVAVILAVEDHESLVETLEILSDPEAAAEIREAEAQMNDGEVYDEADVRAALAARRR